MPITAETRDAIDLKNLALPPSIAVSRVEIEEYTDATGDMALRVLVVLDESMDFEKVSGQDVSDLKFAIRESLRKHGVALFAYIFLAKPSELAETDED